MAEVSVFEPGGYRYVPGVFQYSSGVAAESGFAIERARFRRALPLAAGFAAAEAHLAAIGRPTVAFAACELRSPAPFTDAGFRAFNEIYVGTLERWGIFRDGVNPVARTNVCPIYDKPTAPAMVAFSYTVPAAGDGFVVAGSGEAREGPGDYASRTVRLNDTSPEGLREKVAFVAAEMERRMAALGCGWGDATVTQAYTVQDIGHLVGPELGVRGAMAAGLTWTYARPPVVGLDFEMDVRGVARELVI
ncbi:MAG: hypothetical protein EXQ94_15135 [Alphaproteobacteria bacterium]|nr:hypothetical protein [Alphaproteobacteria bacterium]